MPILYLVDAKLLSDNYIYLKLINSVNKESIYVRMLSSQKGELVDHLILSPGQEEEKYISYVFEIVRHLGDNLTKGLISLCAIEQKKSIDWQSEDKIPDKLQHIDYKPSEEQTNDNQ